MIRTRSRWHGGFWKHAQHVSVKTLLGWCGVSLSIDSVTAGCACFCLDWPPPGLPTAVPRDWNSKGLKRNHCQIPGIAKDLLIRLFWVISDNMLCCQGKTITVKTDSDNHCQDCRILARLGQGFINWSGLRWVCCRVYFHCLYWIDAAAVFLKAFESRPFSRQWITRQHHHRQQFVKTQCSTSSFGIQTSLSSISFNTNSLSTSSTCYCQQACWWPNLQLITSCLKSLPTRFHIWTGQVSRPCTCFILWTPRKLARCGNLAAVPAL